MKTERARALLWWLVLVQAAVQVALAVSQESEQATGEQCCLCQRKREGAEAAGAPVARPGRASQSFTDSDDWERKRVKQLPRMGHQSPHPRATAYCCYSVHLHTHTRSRYESYVVS